VLKTLIEKTAHYLNQKASLPNLGNLPRLTTDGLLLTQ